MFNIPSNPSLLSEEACVQAFLAAPALDAEQSVRASKRAAELIQAVRDAPRRAGSLESFFRQYSLDMPEGLALMELAEALLRVPDGRTAQALIRDKVAGTQWLKTAHGDWVNVATALGLGLSGVTLNSLFSRAGGPVIRKAAARAMGLMGRRFVLGEDMAQAMRQARRLEAQGFRMSYDMLGEGARTAEDAARYFESYKEAIARLDGGSDLGKQPGISVKLSALHPRYSFAQKDKCLPEMTERLFLLCEMAAQKNIPLTVDAEESERLDLSLEVAGRVLERSGFGGWCGFGMAVQAYNKRAPAVIAHLSALAERCQRQIQVRLVKGAYWDSEIKRAQVLGLSAYPVFTRKQYTDASYLVCAKALLQARGWVYPMFGTHNAYTVSAILELAGGEKNSFEFQKLYGMGDALYAEVLRGDTARVSVYAPVGPYKDLLPYLVRRLLENGANSSFVNRVYDPLFASRVLAEDPFLRVAEDKGKPHPQIPGPADLYGGVRKNSAGLDLSDAGVVQKLLRDMHSDISSVEYDAASLISGKKRRDGIAEPVVNPADRTDVAGHVFPASEEDVERAFAAARDGHVIWSGTPTVRRAEVLNNIADAFEAHRAELMALIVREGGRTIPDALDEVREAVDFCRYYAVCGRKDFDENGLILPGPAGERNILRLESRGVFVCISPWNFPLAIFTGQIVAALMAGNAVLAKPAEQTPLTAMRAVQLMHKAGVPFSALALLPGDGRVGAALVDHPDVAGVAFTGSTETARMINRALAGNEGAIPVLIAETGGQNVLIADSSTLPEQVVDDVVRSAFGSAGQRCSACRVLFVQEDIADKVLDMLRGAMAELRMGDPSELSADIGPVIDADALAVLQRHKSRLEGIGRHIASVPMDEDLKRRGNFFAPVAYEIDDLKLLQREVFGPVLHVIRYDAAKTDAVFDAINATGYGLTFGVHTRIHSFAEEAAQRIRAGNVYVNRSMTGAVVGVQPFGGRGLSGTGPKAGGPHYLHRFATEKALSINTAAAGGNASLVMLGD